MDVIILWFVVIVGSILMFYAAIQEKKESIKKEYKYIQEFNKIKETHYDRIFLIEKKLNSLEERLLTQEKNSKTIIVMPNKR